MAEFMIRERAFLRILLFLSELYSGEHSALECFSSPPTEKYVAQLRCLFLYPPDSPRAWQAFRCFHTKADVYVVTMPSRIPS